MVHGGELSDAYWNPPPRRHKVVWTMRNEDVHILRWGQPDFVRDFVQRQGGKDYVGGALIGSECYIPALDYITKDGSHKTWRWAFERQWLYYAVWGHLLYDPRHPTRGSRRCSTRDSATAWAKTCSRHGNWPAASRSTSRRFIGHVGWHPLHGRVLVLDRQG